MKNSLTIGEVAEQERVSKRTVLRWIKTGEVESYKIGGTRRILSDSVQKKSDDQCQPVTPGDIRRG